jgi:hypothetical protein
MGNEGRESTRGEVGWYRRTNGPRTGRDRLRILPETTGRFDPMIAAEVLEWIAELADRRREETSVLDGSAPALHAVASLLEEARSWLDLRITPFEQFAGDVILHGVARGSQVQIDTLTLALRETAAELAQVGTLLELRLPQQPVATHPSPR